MVEKTLNALLYNLVFVIFDEYKNRFSHLLRFSPDKSKWMVGETVFETNDVEMIKIEKDENPVIYLCKDFSSKKQL